MQIVTIGNILQEMLQSVFWEKIKRKKILQNVVCWKFYPAD